MVYGEDMKNLLYALVGIAIFSLVAVILWRIARGITTLLGVTPSNSEVQHQAGVIDEELLQPTTATPFPQAILHQTYTSNQGYTLSYPATYQLTQKNSETMSLKRQTLTSTTDVAQVAIMRTRTRPSNQFTFADFINAPDLNLCNRSCRPINTRVSYTNPQGENGYLLSAQGSFYLFDLPDQSSGEWRMLMIYPNLNTSETAGDAADSVVIHDLAQSVVLP